MRWSGGASQIHDIPARAPTRRCWSGSRPANRGRGARGSPERATTISSHSSPSVRQPEAPSSLASRASTTRRRAAGPGRARVWRVYSPKACRHGSERRRGWPGGQRSQTPADRRASPAAPGRRLRAAAREPGAPARSPPPTQNGSGPANSSHSHGVSVVWPVAPASRPTATIIVTQVSRAVSRGRQARRRGRLAAAEDGNQASRWAVSRRSRSSSSSSSGSRTGRACCTAW